MKASPFSKFSISEEIPIVNKKIGSIRYFENFENFMLNINQNNITFSQNTKHNNYINHPLCT